MDFAQIFQTFLAFVFVLGLMFVTLWLIKLCQQKGMTCRLSKCFTEKSRIKIIEQRRLDIKSSVVLLQCDNQEFLLLLGNNANLLLNQSKIQTKAPHND